jgi:hypothetical protein
MPSADDLHDLRGAGASPYDSEMPTDLDGCIKESAHALGQPRVYDDTYLEMETSHASTPDPADFAVQGARHGQHLSSPAEACTMAGLLSRALIMFTCGVGGPWLSGLGIASCTVTKGLVLAAAELQSASSGSRAHSPLPWRQRAACSTGARRSPTYISVPVVARALTMPLVTRHPRVVRPRPDGGTPSLLGPLGTLT